MITCPFCFSGDIEYLGIDDGGGDFGTSLCDVYRCIACWQMFEENCYDPPKGLREDNLDVQ